MKLRRLLSATLALLLVVSILPLGAFADGTIIGENEKLPQNDHFIEQNLGTITDNGTPGGSNENIEVRANGGTVTNNYACVGINSEPGLVVNNKSGGTVSINMGDGTIETNEGTVGNKNADGTVNTNTGNFATVETNAKDGTVLLNHEGGTVGNKNADGTVDTKTGNFGIVETNEGTVLINQEGGTVETNAESGIIETNKGTVGKADEDGNVVDGSGNDGVIRVNEGHVLTNNNDGIVITNTEDGTIDTNNGLVGICDDAGDLVFNDETGNFGNIGVNNGEITTNGEKATVGTNNNAIYINNGEVTTNDEWVFENNGDIGTNNRFVIYNNGDIGTNNGFVEWNYGTVETNTIDGVVYNETDTNGVTGEVKTNYGTIWTPTEEVNDYGWVIYEAQYGVQVQNTGSGTGNTLLQAVENTILKLAELFQRDGYELVGYEDVTPNSDKENPDGEDYPDEEIPDGDIPAELALNADPDVPELSATDFQAKRPSILSLIWKAITKPASSGGAGDAGPAVLTRLSADKARVGTLIRCGNVIFKIIEVNDDSIRVATVCMLSQQNQKDMMGFLKQYLSAAQIDKFIGQPELLDADEIAEFFGDNRAHIAFYAAKDLFEKN